MNQNTRTKQQTTNAAQGADITLIILAVSLVTKTLCNFLPAPIANTLQPIVLLVGGAALLVYGILRLCSKIKNRKNQPA